MKKVYLDTCAISCIAANPQLLAQVNTRLEKGDVRLYIGWDVLREIFDNADREVAEQEWQIAYQMTRHNKAAKPASLYMLESTVRYLQNGEKPAAFVSRDIHRTLKCNVLPQDVAYFEWHQYGYPFKMSSYSGLKNIDKAARTSFRLLMRNKYGRAVLRGTPEQKLFEDLHVEELWRQWLQNHLSTMCRRFAVVDKTVNSIGGMTMAVERLVKWRGYPLWDFNMCMLILHVKDACHGKDDSGTYSPRNTAGPGDKYHFLLARECEYILTEDVGFRGVIEFANRYGYKPKAIGVNDFVCLL